MDQYLPSGKQLAFKFGVSRPTVRRALKNIEALGLISRRQGDGTKVMASKPFTDYRYTTRPVDDLLYGRGAERIVTGQDEVVCNKELAAKLGAAPGSQWLQISQHRNDLDSQCHSVEVSINIFPEARSAYGITLSHTQERVNDR